MLRRDLGLPRFKTSHKAGFTILELVIVITLIAIIGSVIATGAFSYRGQKDLDSTTLRIASLLREMQARSMAQSSSTSWGVHFDNPATGQAFFSSFYSTYSTSTRSGLYLLSSSLGFSSSTVPVGGSINVTFNSFSGSTATTTAVKVYLKNKPQSSSTITIYSSGAVSY